MQRSYVSTYNYVMQSIQNLYSVAQAARELHLSVRAVQHRISKGQIKAEKIGEGRTSAYVITRAEIERVKAQVAA